ncbi:ATP-dependent helicase HrpB [Actinoplanes octamycinicus]|uniref:ATP-dependent helicase HrpB n=1 Tax=Actinoplanes octamycinicus TaxID=135948 RepID=A0A7W7MCW7_9ACTN|nr:ATP-dependent helicase HrpB [Actinoplanes octamycinicus]MBB4745621.1 ATP-dependent helicase HrpB [Actinoplanes octamycinicus]GIE56464.1 ATP-dependent helicase [Actinoplanes octamycinicus]
MLIPADTLPDLPVRDLLPEVTATLAESGAAVLVAPPGTGKTTLVPLALAGAGRVIVAEPRRVAARAAARRMAALLGEPVGERVGYAVRGERRVSRRTVVEVVTTGLLVRRLQRDQELSGTTTVVLDECHERHLDSDLALAFLVEVRGVLRPELRLLATSATADAERLAEVLDGPVLTAYARTHPVETVWTPPPGPVAPPHGLRVDPKLLDHVAATTRRALAEGDGDVLVFLPGAREIETVAGRLRGVDAEVLTLHGRQSGTTQDAALRPGPGRRVVLATAIAESSLTVPGVRAVVDCGLSRVPRMDHARGLGALATVPVSRSSATQRAGRAGREAPGRAYRCWSEAQHERLPAQPEPEIAAADLTGFALDLALWGDPEGSGLALPDAPPPGALRAASATLHDLGAIDAAGRVTARGRALAGAGLHPRLARALLDGAPLVGARRAAEIIAVFDDPRSAGDDLVAAVRRARAAGDPGWRAEVRRLTAATDPSPEPPVASSSAPPAGGSRIPDDLAVGLVVGLAYPERVALAREPGGRAYLMAGGTAADLPAESSLAGTRWLAVAAADRAPGARTARIRSAAPLDEETAREVAGPLLTEETEIGWIDGDVVARRVRRLGAITLAGVRLTDPDPAALREALLTGLRTAGLGLLTWSRTAEELRARLAFAHAALGDPWPDVSDAALLDHVEEWLDLGSARRRADLARLDVASALRRLLPWSVAGRLDEVAPERLPVPSGSQIRLDYSDPTAPVLAVKVQEAFGWRDAPRLADGRIPVLLHLLSPAGRPVAVTRDLASFWQQGYPQVRAEMRGRYPRHPWPEDPLTAAPTRRANPRSR